MKTKKILTLLIAMLIGVYLSAQNDGSVVPKPDQQKLDYLKILWVMEYGSSNPALVYYLLFSNMHEQPQPPVKTGDKYSLQESAPVNHIIDQNNVPGHYAKKRPRIRGDFDTRTYPNVRKSSF